MEPPYGDGRHATTTYLFDPHWDAVTRVTLPEGELSLMQYDSVGRRLWEQVGPDDARRVRYEYLPDPLRTPIQPQPPSAAPILRRATSPAG